jgi:hypothetical protein
MLVHNIIEIAAAVRLLHFQNGAAAAAKNRKANQYRYYDPYQPRFAEIALVEGVTRAHQQQPDARSNSSRRTHRTPPELVPLFFLFSIETRDINIGNYVRWTPDLFQKLCDISNTLAIAKGYSDGNSLLGNRRPNT